MLTAVRATAQTPGPYQDSGLLGLLGDTRLGFRLDATLGGAVITDIGGYDLPGNSGELQIPGRVFDGSISLTILINAGLNVNIDISELTDWLTGGIPVVGIGNSAFYNSPAITGLDFTQATSLKVIDNAAFDSCSGLTGALTIPDGVTTIGSTAFFNCSGLTGGLTLPSGLTTIGESAFNACSGLTGMLTIPNGVKSIPTNAFYNCSGFTGSLAIPDGVTSIGNAAFFQCSGFTGTLTLPASLTYIGAQSFQMCNFTGDLDLSALKSLTVINRDAFYNNTSGQFTGILTLPEGGALKIIGRGAFEYGRFVNDDLSIPSTVTDVGVYSLALFNVRGITFKSIGTINLGDSLFTLNTKMEYVDMSTATIGQSVQPGGTYSGAIVSLVRNGAQSPFTRTSAHTLIYLPKGTPQSLIDATVPNNVNYVLDDKCDWFQAQEGYDYYIPHAFTATKATWNVSSNSIYVATATRTFTAGNYSTVYLPYQFKLTDSTKFKGYKLHGKANPEDTDLPHVFRFKQQDPTSFVYQANTPYVIKCVAAGVFPEANDVNVPATSDAVGRVMYDAGTPGYDGLTATDNSSGGIVPDPVSGTWGFYGSTEKIPVSLQAGAGGQWNVYILGGNAWNPFTADLNPLRAFISGSNTAVGAKPIFQFVNMDGTEDTTTGIGGLGLMENGETRVYNISGQYIGKDINALPSGMYIVNGKKIIK